MSTKSITMAASGAGGGGLSYVAVAIDSLPGVYVWPVSAAGFGTRFSNPSTQIGGDRARSVKFNPTGTAVAVGSTGSPFVQVYAWDKTTGFGTKYSNPSGGPYAQVFGIAWHPSANSIFFAVDDYPYVGAWEWSNSTGFGNKYTNPSPASGRPVWARNTMHPAGTAYAQANITYSPFINAWPWNNPNFGTKYSAPSTVPTAECQQMAFSPSGNYLAVAVGTDPAVLVYNWNSSTGFGSKFTDPTSRPSDAYGVAWTNAENAIAVSSYSTSSLYVAVWPWSSSGFGTRYTSPSTLPTGTSWSCAFSPDDSLLAVGHQSSPFLTIYNWTPSGFGSKLANPAQLPGDTVRDVTFSPL
jgi:WD40 repeat protein